MLQITVPAMECWNENIQEFVNIKAQTLQLEHSLVSVSKWERKWHKPFFSKEPKTNDEVIDYIKCMTLTMNVSPETFMYLGDENIEKIKDYIDDPMTATTFSDDKNHGKNREQTTSELIYYWMISLGIPVEFEKWHLNRLLTLIRVCEVKNQPAKKVSRHEKAKQYAAMNAARRKKYNTRG